nr:HlyD family efflux transporter periplasmic adaptor subunit [Bacilli bacterium]
MSVKITDPPAIQLTTKKRWRKKSIYASLAVLIVLGGAGYAYLRLSKSHTAIPTTDIYTVGLGDITQTISASGTIAPAKEEQLSFTGTSGAVQSIPVTVGQKVTKGEVLASLDSSSQQIAYQEAQVSVTSAKASLQSAIAKAAQTAEPPTATTIASAKLAVTKAQQTLSSALQQLHDQQLAYNDRTSAKQAVISAENSLTQQQNALEQAQLSEQKAVLQAKESQSGATPADIAVLKNNVIVAQQGVTSANQQLSLAQSNLSILYQNLQLAEQTLSNDSQNNASATQIQADENAVRQAQSSYNSGQSSLLNSQNSVTNAESSLENAQKTLGDAQPASNTPAGQLIANSLASAKASLASANQQDQAAKENLAISQAIYNDRLTAQEQVQNAQTTVAQDQLSLQSAKISLAQTLQPLDPNVIAQSNASVLQAKASLANANAQLQSAKQNLSGTTIIAPINGIVAAINITQGQSDTSNNNPAIIVDGSLTSNLEQTVSVPESEIGSVKPGETVTATATAFPTQTFTGKVLTVNPIPQVVSNVTEYTVTTSIQNVSNELKPGMTTQVTITTNTANNVITVPAIALTTIGNLEGVYVVGTRKPGRFGGQFGGGFRHRGGTGQGAGTGSSSTTTGAAFGQGTMPSSTSSTGNASSTGNTSRSSFGSSLTSTPYGNQVYFQPVTVGLFGTSSVQITKGLTAGEQILLVAPATAASSSTATSTRGGFGGGLGLGGGLGGGRLAGGGGGGKQGG